MYTQGRTIYEAWYRLLDTLVHFPERTIAPRGLATQEILGVQLEVHDLRANLLVHPARNLNYRFAVAELLWIAFGLDDLAILTRYNKQMSRFSDDGLKLAGAYGPRLATQWEYVINTLRRDTSSRQAVAAIWTPNPTPSKDVPCTVSTQWLIRENKLHVIVTMRSSDIWLGVPYDAHVFGQLTNMLAGVLGVETGSMVMQLGSSHLYTENLEAAEKVIDSKKDGGTIVSPALPGWPDAHSKLGLLNVLQREGALVDNQGRSVVQQPWDRYAAALLADTWTEARLALESEATDERFARKL
jgi:thymidylate synthase